MSDSPVAIITGGARRIGRAIAEYLHGEGYCILIHHWRSKKEAGEVLGRLNDRRANSTSTFCGDLADAGTATRLVNHALKVFGRIDVLVNNAARFYPSPIQECSPEQWHDIVDTNLKAPFFLAQAARRALTASQGNIVNLTDIYGRQALADHPAYIASKAGLLGLTRALAVDLAPMVRVNAIAPGAMIWHTHSTTEQQQEIVQQIPLQRRGDVNDIARAVYYLITSGNYISGQELTIDGGRSIKR